MKRLSVFLLAAVAVLPIARSGAAGDQDFILVNKTGVEIHNLHLSPSDENEWGEDVLGKETLGDGETVKIAFHPKEEAAKWDLRVADKEGNAITWEDLNLLKISRVTLHYADGKATAEVE